MGEFSMQIFYLFVYILVICECVPVISEENLKEHLYDDEWTKREIKGELFSETIDKLSGKENENSIKLDTHLPSLLSNISNEIIGQVQNFAENVVNFLKDSLLANVKQIEEFNMSTRKGGIVINSDSTRNVHHDSNGNTRGLDSSKLTKTGHNTSPVVGYWHDSMPQRSKEHHSKHTRKIRKYRRKRSFFLDYGLGMNNIFEDDGSDVIFGAHTSPCAHADRHYCLNGGTCVFLGALEIKTCRCSIGYTGLRCEMINQEYILALLSQEFFG